MGEYSSQGNHSNAIVYRRTVLYGTVGIGTAVKMH